MAAYCEKYDLPAASCGHCTGAEARAAQAARDEQPVQAPVIDARWPGRCANCEREIRPGDQIRSDGAKGWLCPVCIS
jgi:hypothetical protein